MRPCVQVCLLLREGVTSKIGHLAATQVMLAKIGELLPTHTRRSEENRALQQFSTPIALGIAASAAAAITSADAMTV